MPHRQKKTEGIKIMVTPAELAAIDRFADHGGHWSRAEAVRRLVQKGYAAFLSETDQPDIGDAAVERQVERKP